MNGEDRMEIVKDTFGPVSAMALDVIDSTNPWLYFIRGIRTLERVDYNGGHRQVGNCSKIMSWKRDPCA